MCHSQLFVRKGHRVHRLFPMSAAHPAPDSAQDQRRHYLQGDPFRGAATCRNTPPQDTAPPPASVSPSSHPYFVYRSTASLEEMCDRLMDDVTLVSRCVIPSSRPSLPPPSHTSPPPPSQPCGGWKILLADVQPLLNSSQGPGKLIISN